MRLGKLISEGTAGQLRFTLNERILELRGSPLALLRRIAAQDPGVEDVRTFGDRLHLRVKPGTAERVGRLRTLPEATRATLAPCTVMLNYPFITGDKLDPTT